MSNKDFKNEAFKDFLALDFLEAIEDRLMGKGLTHKDLAGLLSISESAVSQMFQKPNFTLKKLIEISQALGLKVGLITYDDNDPDNKLGPIFGELFTEIWDLHNKPRDFQDLENVIARCQHCSNRGGITIFNEPPELLTTWKISSLSGETRADENLAA